MSDLKAVMARLSTLSGARQEWWTALIEEGAAVDAYVATADHTVTDAEQMGLLEGLLDARAGRLVAWEDVRSSTVERLASKQSLE